MTVIKIFSRWDTFSDFVESCPLKNVECKEKGECFFENSRRVYDAYRLIFEFSTKEWDDLPGQVVDAKRFLRKNDRWVRKALRNRRIHSAFIDFPIFSRLSDHIAGQNDFFDAELLLLCGRLGLAINLTTYQADFPEGVLERARKRKARKS